MLSLSTKRKPTLDFIPLFALEPAQIRDLLNQEHEEWLNELGWDNTPVQELILEFIGLKGLPGFAAVNGREPVGYTYYITNDRTGLIGTLYVSEKYRTSDLAPDLLRVTVEAIRASDYVRRIEAQLFPFGAEIKSTFLELGFHFYQRYYLSKSLSTLEPLSANSSYRLETWHDRYMDEAVSVVYEGYKDSVDADICSGYRAIGNCADFVKNLITNPGCGIFSPSASSLAFDRDGNLCGVVLASSISKTTGFIPQISVHPRHQGRGVGGLLIFRALERFSRQHYKQICLSVTERNERAFEWYKKIGFSIKKPLLAFVWQRG